MRPFHLAAGLGLVFLGVVVLQLLGSWGGGGAAGEERAVEPSSSPLGASSADPAAERLVDFAPVEASDQRSEAAVEEQAAPGPVAAVEAEVVEEVAPRINRPSISGVILDRDGLPQAAADLVLRWADSGEYEDPRGDRYDFEAQKDGAFLVPVDREGTAEVWAEADGVGRSLALQVIVPAAGSVSVGELRLVGPGRITGRLQLPDGTPLGDVSFGVTALDEEALGGALSASQYLESDGRFDLQGLAPGQYEFYAFSPAPLDIIRPKTVAATTEDCIVEASALLLTIRCKRDGEIVPMRAYKRRALVDPDRPADESKVRISGNSQSFGEPVPEVEALFSANERFALRGIDTEGRSYYGLVEPGLPPGRHEIDLAPTHPEFSIARFRLDEPVAGSSLLVKNVFHEGGRATVVFRPDSSSIGADGWKEVVCQGEGAFEFDLSLSRAGGRVLAEPVAELVLQRGRAVERIVQTVVGGRMELSVDGEALAGGTDEEGRGHPGNAWSYLRQGSEDEWESVLFKLPGVNGGFANRTINVGGEPLLSVPLRPGTYDLKVTCKGYRTHVQRVAIEPGAATQYTVRLERKD